MVRVLLAALLLALPLTARADWPQWRGPTRDGTAAAAFPAKWAAEAPAAKWTAAVGKGCSGPAVAGGRVFVMGREKDTERCLCVEADTGKELWRVEYPVTFEAPDPTVPNGPMACPCVDRDRVYFYGQHGMLHAVQIATGKVLWKHDCVKEYWGVAKGKLGDDSWFPPCGSAASPMVDGDLVLVPIGGKKAGAFTAFNRTTGEIVWKALDDRSSYASPVIKTAAGVEQLIGFTGTRMVGLRHRDRELLWDYPFETKYEQTIICPIVWEDTVVVCGEAKPTVALKLTRNGDKVVQTEAWRSKDLQAYMTTPVAIGDHIVGYDQRTNRLVCVGIKTGETAWTTPERVPGKYHSLVKAGGVLLVLNSEGELFVFKATPADCELLVKWKVSEKGSWAHLAADGNRLYVKDKDTLRCIEVK